jgi:hypothetical protein
MVLPVPGALTEQPEGLSHLRFSFIDWAGFRLRGLIRPVSQAFGLCAARKLFQSQLEMFRQVLSPDGWRRRADNDPTRCPDEGSIVKGELRDGCHSFDASNDVCHMGIFFIRLAQWSETY